MVHKRKRAVQTTTTKVEYEVGTPSYFPVQAKVRHTTQNDLTQAILASPPTKRRTRRRKSFLYRA